MLAGAGLGDDPRLAHAFGEQGLTDGVVDLVSTGVVEILALQVNLGAAQLLGQTSSVVERGRSADEVLEIAPKLRQKPGVLAGLAVELLQLIESVHEGLGNKATAVLAEVAAHRLVVFVKSLPFRHVAPR